MVHIRGGARDNIDPYIVLAPANAKMACSYTEFYYKYDGAVRLGADGRGKKRYFHAMVRTGVDGPGLCIDIFVYDFPVDGVIRSVLIVF